MVNYFDIALFLVPWALLIALLWWLRRDRRRLIERMRTQGRDPDQMFIGAIGRLQSEEKRRRGPVGWVAMKYVQWSHRDAQR